MISLSQEQPRDSNCFGYQYFTRQSQGHFKHVNHFTHYFCLMTTICCHINSVRLGNCKSITFENAVALKIFHCSADKSEALAERICSFVGL